VNALLAAACGIAVLGGLVLVMYGLRRTRVVRRPGSRSTSARRSLGETWARLTRRPPGTRGRKRDRLLLIGFGAGLVGYLATGWFLLLPVVPVAFVVIPYLLGDPPNREVELLSGLDRWVRGMAATLQSGQSISDTLRSSARNAPPMLAEEVRLLVLRLEHRWPVRDGLQAMADALDSPDADAVLAALALAAHRGGTGATSTLNALTESIQDRLRALRDIESERAKPRVVVRQVTVISLAVLGIALVVGGEFFAPYRSGIGQAILAALLTAYVASLLVMRRVTAPPRRQRILQEARS
jgi:tight adherence protein B